MLRRVLPVFGLAHTGRYATCVWKCGSACFRPPPNRSENEPFEAVVARAVSRRAVLKGGFAAAMVLSTGCVASPARVRPGAGPAALGASGPSLAFTPIEPSILDDVVVPGGYAWEVLVRWGEPILEGAPGFDFNAQTPAAQAGQFGYNCDYVAFIPTTGTEGVLWVNHEFTNPEIMFPDWNQETSTRAHVEIEMAALGGSVVAVERVGPGRYRFAPGHQRNRRITVFTPMEITGPAAGAELLETSEDPTGTRVLGTLNNCAGGLTPWGTILTCAGNFDEFFANVEAVTDPRIRALHDRIGFNEGPHRADGSCTIPVSTSARSPRSHSGSAGSWRSIPATRRSCHASARRSGGSSTKPRRRRSHGTGGSRSTSVTTSGSSTSTSS